MPTSLLLCPSIHISTELLFGVILAVIVSNFVAHHLHPDGLYEAELEQSDGTCFYLRQVSAAGRP